MEPPPTNEVPANEVPAFADATVVVTGGTGSFGQTVTRRLLEADVGQVRILSRDELKQHEMRTAIGDPRVEFHLGDVRDAASIGPSMAGADFVFHAAALKQVPSCEFFPLQAVQTNVLGSSNVIEAAEAAGVRSVVCLSTDKAVAPENVMGMSKALMERVCIASARRPSSTVSSVVRYGNVLYSRGSVVPLFVQQIMRGEDLTVTDPHMTRFLMPLRDAVDLVEFAFANAQPGDVFIKRAPAATIGDLAKAVNSLFGDPVGVRQIGVRHGEKAHETLATGSELTRAEELGDDFVRIPMDARSLNYEAFYDAGHGVDALAEPLDSSNTELLDAAQIADLLLTLPEIKETLDTWTRS